MNETFLITGATGKTAALVARQLHTQGADVRALVRNETKAAGLAAAGVTLALGDFTDAAPEVLESQLDERRDTQAGEAHHARYFLG